VLHAGGVQGDHVVTDKATVGPCQTVVIAAGYEPDIDLSMPGQ
jgi:hypothetical protein